MRIGALGSGSDYTPFLQHLGVSTLNLGFGGEDSGGSYHSIYDSFDHYTRFGDPGFDYGVALAQVVGRVVLRFAEADHLPLNFTNYADTVARYVREVSKLADDTREEIAEKNRRITEGTFAAVSDPTQTYVMPKAESPAPAIDFAPLQSALARLQASSQKYHAALASTAGQAALARRPRGHRAARLEGGRRAGAGRRRRPRTRRRRDRTRHRTPAVRSERSGSSI
jgi:N-acetylated-alpha-linked acidic dipeptidase